MYLPNSTTGSVTRIDKILQSSAKNAILATFNFIFSKTLNLLWQTLNDIKLTFHDTGQFFNAANIQNLNK